MTTRSPQRLDARLTAEVRNATGLFAANVIAQFTHSLLILLQAFLFSHLVSRAFHERASLETITLPAIMLMAVSIGRGVLTFLTTQTAAALALHVKGKLRERYLRHLFALGPSYTQGERSGDLTLLASEGLDKLDAFYRDYLPAVVAALLLPLTILGAVWPLDMLTFVVLLVSAPLIPLFMALVGMAAGILAKQQFLQMRLLGAHFLDVMQGLVTLKLFNRSQFQAERIQQITEQFRTATMQVLRVAFLSAFTLELLATLSVAIVAVEIGVRLLNGGISFERALFLLVIAPEFYMPLRAFGAKFHAATESKAVAERLYRVLDTMPPPPRPTQPMPDSFTVRFEEVSFSYQDRARPALNAVSFDLVPGQFTAIVGGSGSGKSTIASLLLGFITPQAGAITVGGVNLASLPPDEWRERIAWVPQTPSILSGTIADNIRLSRPDAPQNAMVAAAKHANVDEFAADWPDGYETRCGERGMRLSGGQAQRIALARAFLRDAPLLILDEPTSHLDPETERKIMRPLRRISPGQTILLIAHRLSTVREADWILVMHDGHIVEQGTHDLLMANDGPYRALVQQFEEDSDAS